MTRDDYTLNELTEVAGVSPRTVRYYIAEGLLPPPVVAGPRSSYSSSHLNRLRLIGSLKNAYLPLREIRRQLDGMSDPEIEATLQQTVELEEHESAPDPYALHDDAGSYISRALGSSPIRHLRPSGQSPRVSTVDRTSATGGDRSIESDDPFALSNHLSMQPLEMQAIPDNVAWRRIELGPDAELLIREDAYHRKRDRVEWLINWAKRVFN